MSTDQKPPSLDLAHEADFVVGGLTVRPSLREVANGEQREILQPRVMQALTLLSRRRGEVVSRDDLIAVCWDGRIVGDDAINACVAKVRKLGEANAAFGIETIPRVGYRLVEADGANKPVEHTPSRRMWIAAALAILVVLAAAAAFWMIRAPSAVRVAVEPLAVAGQDPASAALAARVRDEVVQVLSARQVAVTARPSSRGARLIVGGTLERAGGVAHVRVHIDDQRSRLVLWQGEFDGPDSADSPVAERTAAKVTDLLANAVNWLNKDPRTPPEALKALFFGLDARRDGRANEALQFFSTIHKLQPNLALANASYAQVLAGGAAAQPPAVAAQWKAQAERLTKRALELDPKEPSVYFALGQLTPRLGFARRQQILSDGLKQAPDDGSLLTSQGVLLSEIGRPKEGLTYVRRGLSLDPLSQPKNFGATGMFGTVGLTDEGLALLQKARRIWPAGPNHVAFTAAFAVDFADPQTGLQLLSELRSQHPEFEPEAQVWSAGLTALACACGKAEAAQRITDATAEGTVQASVAWPLLLRLGDTSGAFEMAAQARTFDTRLLFAPVAAPMRAQPRFMDLAAKLGLAQYWTASGRWPEFCAEPGLAYDCNAEAARAIAATKSAG